MVDILDLLRYNTHIAKRNYMELHKQLTQLLLQVQTALEEDYSEHPAIQDAFNALVCAIDEEML